MRNYSKHHHVIEHDPQPIIEQMDDCECKETSLCPLIDTTPFYVIAVCSNPVRFHRRWTLFKEFEQHMKDIGAKLIVIEQCFGRRHPVLTDRNNPYHLQLRTDQELWHKENMINIGVQHLTKLDPKWKYVAWIDGDIHFQRRDIVAETVHQLQHYNVVQMFSHVVDLGPNYDPIKQYSGFMWAYHQNGFNPPIGPGNGGYYSYDTGFWHPGYAWAATRWTMERLPLFDKAILGAGDHHMALSLIGQAKKSLPGNISKGYRDAVLEWENIALNEVRRNVGYVPGMISHHWHGKKKDRKYVERWKVITDLDFDPNKDLIRDNQGMFRLNMHHGCRSEKLRDKIRQYFRQRNEDSIDYE